MATSHKTILAIETSCDETAAAVLIWKNQASDFPKIISLSAVVKSQIKLHSKMGGVVPEAAARAHVKNILPVTQKALADAKIKLSEIDYIAVTKGPGLIPSLIVGVEFAKTLAMALNKPVIPVNHMLGHLYSPWADLKIEKLKIERLFPQVALIVSGGHTMLVLLKNIGDYKIIGETVDDAAGEAFDKVAKMLSLPYPGGPEVSKLAEQATQPVEFPRPMINSKNYNFSFSGLKTAVLYYLKDNPLTPKSYSLKANVCAGFQNAAIDVLVTKTLRAAKEFKARSISLSGGVSANKSLRDKLKVESKKLKVEFFVPGKGLSTDNAEMIGLAAVFMLHTGYQPQSYKQIKADSNLSL